MNDDMDRDLAAQYGCMDLLAARFPRQFTREPFKDEAFGLGWAGALIWPAGWHALVVSVCADLEAAGIDVCWRIVSESFAELRMHPKDPIEDPDQRATFFAIVDHARQASRTTCMRCGASGHQLQSQGIWRVECAACLSHGGSA